MTKSGIVGIEDHGEDSIEDRVLRAANQTLRTSQGRTTSASDAPARKLPPHLQNRIKSSNAGSTTGSATTSEAGGETSTAGTSQRLPPHLRNKVANSVSTATTVRQEREEIKKWNSQTYNAYGPNGETAQRVHQPPSAPSTVTSDFPSSSGSRTPVSTVSCCSCIVLK